MDRYGQQYRFNVDQSQVPEVPQKDATVGSAAGAAAAGGMGPAAAIAGGSFLANYLQSRAAEEQKRRDTLAQMELAKGEAFADSGKMQNQAAQNMLNAFAQVLLGRN